MAKATTTSPVTFTSKYRQYLLILEPSYPVVTGVHKMWTKGIEVQFENFKFKTDDAELIAKLRECPSFGEDYFENPADVPAQNPETPAKVEPTEPPVVQPRKRGARSTVDAAVKTDS